MCSSGKECKSQPGVELWEDDGDKGKFYCARCWGEEEEEEEESEGYLTRRKVGRLIAYLLFSCVLLLLLGLAATALLPEESLSRMRQLGDAFLRKFEALMQTTVLPRLRSSAGLISVWTQKADEILRAVWTEHGPEGGLEAVFASMRAAWAEYGPRGGFEGAFAGVGTKISELVFAWKTGPHGSSNHTEA